MKRVLKSAIQIALAPMGLKIVRRTSAVVEGDVVRHSMPTCAERLQHIHTLGFEAADVVDAGAHVGDWTTMAASIFTEARFLVIEPNPTVQDCLTQNLSVSPESFVIIAKAVGGKAPARKTQHLGGPGGGNKCFSA